MKRLQTVVRFSVKMSLSKFCDSSDDELEPRKFIVETDVKKSTSDTEVLRANFASRSHALEWLKNYKKETSTEWISQECRRVEK